MKSKPKEKLCPVVRQAKDKFLVEQEAAKMIFEWMSELLRSDFKCPKKPN